MRLHRSLASLLLSVALTGCAVGMTDEPVDNDPPLSDLDSLLGDAPPNSSLPDENKADAHYPAQYFEPRQWQSPVKSQGSRGVCSIFSSIAHMEHLYIKEGTITEPDFSEQYLQWSVKFEVNSFPNSSGSSAYYNLQAINRFGVVEESVYPYETTEWGPADDPACEGDDRPTYCYTNGHPPDEVKNAPKYKLPRGRYLNTNSIKAHMTTKKTAVETGMTFFYQAWNHRRSELPTNSEYWRQGYVLYPNERDKELSLQKRAGHSILLVGWDDDLEVPIVDENGEAVTDADGNPVTEKGFYLFKNSWGRGNFGRDNPHGDGYGWISMRYVHEYASAYVSDLPVIETPAEACGDGIDNDRDGAIDCEDTDCSADPACGSFTTRVYESTETVDIPDNNPVGAASVITVNDTGTIAAVKVRTEIDHTYRGDLRVTLYHGDKAAVLHNRTGGADDDLRADFDVADFTGDDLAGEWRLKVEDLAAADTGRIEGWSLEVTTRQ